MFIVLCCDLAVEEDGQLWAVVPEFDDPLADEAWHWQHGYCDAPEGDRPAPGRRGPADDYGP